MIQKIYFKTKDYCKVKFSFTPEIAATVEILGLNNDWEHAVLMSKKKNGSFAAEVNLPKNSTHQFKYFINQAEWLNDETADSFEPNEYGNTNSVITI